MPAPTEEYLTVCLHRPPFLPQAYESPRALRVAQAARLERVFLDDEAAASAAWAAALKPNGPA